jgi:hypothetical protein
LPILSDLLSELTFHDGSWPKNGRWWPEWHLLFLKEDFLGFLKW